MENMAAENEKKMLSFTDAEPTFEVRLKEEKAIGENLFRRSVMEVFEADRTVVDDFKNVRQGESAAPKLLVTDSDNHSKIVSFDNSNQSTIPGIRSAGHLILSPKPRKKKAVIKTGNKVNELTAEGKNAIDSPGSPTHPDLPPQDYILDEYEERSMIEPSSYDDPRLKELINVLIEWINDELAGHRIIVKDIEEDLYDGQILQKLLEKLTDIKLDVVEVTQSEEGQKIKLKRILDATSRVLGQSYWNQQKWNVESIHSKNVIAILHLLVALARHFRAPIRLPENVVVNVVVVQKREGMLHTRTIAEELTSTYDDLGLRVERDAFDTLFDHAPDKLQVVKKSLVTFVNKHLNRINLEVTDLDNQFHDGVYLTLLMGLLEGYFVPLYSFNLTPTSFEQKVHNVSVAFELMMDAGLQKPKARPEDIVNLDLKSTLRVLYNLFTKYKHLS